MPVFKLCLQVYKKKLKVMFIYFGVFLIISLMVVNATKATNQKGFSQTKTNIAFISEDESPLIEGLRENLKQIANIIDVANEKSAMQDALFFREVSYILRVPENYTEKFMAGEEVYIEKTTLPNSVDSIYINLQVDQYLRLAKIYLATSDMDEATLAKNIEKDMSIKTEVVMNQKEEESQDQSYAMYFYNYMGYSLFAILILGISTVLLVFNEVDIRRRNNCSPIKSGSMNLQFLLANITFSLICWAIYVGFCIFFNAGNNTLTNTLLFMLNSFVFTICVTSISFLIGNLVKNREAISALANVIALGTSFISGVFVPQELLSESVLKLASFTPTYWYVRGNNLIGQMSTITSKNMNELFSFIGVEIVFIVAFIALALVLGKRREMA